MTKYRQYVVVLNETNEKITLLHVSHTCRVDGETQTTKITAEDLLPNTTTAQQAIFTAKGEPDSWFVKYSTEKNPSAVYFAEGVKCDLANLDLMTNVVILYGPGPGEAGSFSVIPQKNDPCCDVKETKDYGSVDWPSPPSSAN